jgi:hypothetical protein
MHNENHSVGDEQVSQDTLEAFYQVPTSIYSYEMHTDRLHRTSLVTGERSCHRVSSYTFKFGCCWSEVTGGSLFVTGGRNRDFTAVREVVRIDTRREFAVSHCVPCSLLEKVMLQCITLHISTSLEDRMADA